MKNHLPLGFPRGGLLQSEICDERLKIGDDFLAVFEAIFISLAIRVERNFAQRRQAFFAAGFQQIPVVAERAGHILQPVAADFHGVGQQECLRVIIVQEAVGVKLLPAFRKTDCRSNRVENLKSQGEIGIQSVLRQNPLGERVKGGNSSIVQIRQSFAVKLSDGGVGER